MDGRDPKLRASNSVATYLKALQLFFASKGREQANLILKRLLPQSTLTKIVQKLDVNRQYPVQIGHPDRISILLVGVGGTGSFTAHILAQLAEWAIKKAALDVRLYFIDPDVVEPKNMVRQNFCEAEIGRPKAATLAWRYNAAFGLNIIPVIEKFKPTMLERFKPSQSTNGSLMMVVGAVDNYQARCDIAQAVTDRLTGRLGLKLSSEKLWWLDAGNERTNGQVLIGNSLDPLPGISPLRFCLEVPFPHVQEPTILQPKTQYAATQTEPDLSCADLTLLEEQSAMINRMMASVLGVYLYRLLQKQDLNIMKTFVALEAMTMRSVPITGGRLLAPPLPQVRTLHPIPMATTNTQPGECPVCGAMVVEGTDTIRGVQVAVRFCSECQWREEGCPNCGHEFSETEIELEDHQIVPGLECSNCDWHAPYQLEVNQEPHSPEMIVEGEVTEIAVADQ